MIGTGIIIGAVVIDRAHQVAVGRAVYNRRIRIGGGGCRRRGCLRDHGQWCIGLAAASTAVGVGCGLDRSRCGRRASTAGAPDSDLVPVDTTRQRPAQGGAVVGRLTQSAKGRSRNPVASRCRRYGHLRQFNAGTTRAASPATAGRIVGTHLHIVSLLRRETSDGVTRGRARKPLSRGKGGGGKIRRRLRRAGRYIDAGALAGRDGPVCGDLAEIAVIAKPSERRHAGEYRCRCTGGRTLGRRRLTAEVLVGLAVHPVDRKRTYADLRIRRQTS